MNLRLQLSKLAGADARQSAARALAVICATGYVLTLAVIFASGNLQRWLFALLGWSLFVYLPLRILLEAFQTVAPRMRQRLVAQTEGRADRYGSRASIELMVDGLFDREVVMPRIATPVQTAQAKAGASAVLVRLRRHTGAGLQAAVARCLGTVETWITELADWSMRAASGNIQARWSEIRALAALAAMTKVLAAAQRDQSGEDDPIHKAAEAFLEACLDHCDRLALEVDVAPWNEPALGLAAAADRAAAMTSAWMEYCGTTPPALEAREAFVREVLPTAS